MIINKEVILSKLEQINNSLKPRQTKVSLPIVIRIVKKMKSQIKFPPIFVSSDNLIVNGHHRYISSILTDVELEIISDYPRPSLVNEIDWISVDFVEEDWDTQAEIKLLNEQDAHYNGLSMEDVESIIS